MEEYLNMIQGSISARQNELHRVTEILAKAAQRVNTFSVFAKVILVLLGAFVSTREATNQLLGANSSVSIIVYTLAGLIIATIAGLEAAFKWESRSAEMRILAAVCQSTVRQVDSRWQKEIGTVEKEQRLAAARTLIDLQDAKLTEVQEKAATLGVNITLEVIELQPEIERRNYAA